METNYTNDLEGDISDVCQNTSQPFSLNISAQDYTDDNDVNDVNNVTLSVDDNVLIESVRTKQHNQKDVWIYFLKDHERNRCVCQVNECGKVIKGLFTTNCLKHLKSCHKEIGKLFVKKTNHSIPSIYGQQVIKKFNSTHPMQAKFERFLAVLVGSEPVPFNIVEKNSFRKMIESICPLITVPYRPALMKRIISLEEEMKTKIIKRLELADNINIIIDIWTKKGMSSSFIGIMVTFYDKKDKERKCLALAVRAFEGDSHTWERINSKTFMILKEYNINKDKIFRIITDNGSNMVKAFTMEDYSTEILDYDHSESCYITNIENAKCLLRCFIHSILLELKKVEKDPVIGELVDRLKDFVKCFKHSTKLTETLKIKSGKSLISFSSTRWNYIYLVIERLIAVKQDLIDVLDENMSPLSITSEDWTTIESLFPFLRLFWKATNSSSKEKDIEITEVLPTVRDLLDQLPNTNSIMLSSTIDLVKAGLKKRFACIFEPNSPRFDPIFITATWLDPRYRRSLSDEEIQVAKDYILTLDFIDTDFMQPLIPTKQTKFACANVTPNQILLQKPQLRCEIEHWHTDPSYHIYDDYLDLIIYWNEKKDIFKLLSNIALNLICVPSSSASVERLFSLASYACANRRNRLDGDNLEREVLLNKNRWILDTD